MPSPNRLAWGTAATTGLAWVGTMLTKLYQNSAVDTPAFHEACNTGAVVSVGALLTLATAISLSQHPRFQQEAAQATSIEPPEVQ